MKLLDNVRQKERQSDGSQMGVPNFLSVIYEDLPVWLKEMVIKQARKLR